MEIILECRNIYGEVENKVEIAIERLKLLESDALRNHPNGFVVTDSGGKDSTVIKHLALLSGVKFQITHNLTTIDHPETMYFLKREKQRFQELGIDFTILKPENSFWKEIETRGVPTRTQRWCCAVFKEGKDEDRFVILGVRNSESNKRKKRRAFEFGEYKKDLVRISENTAASHEMIWRCAKDGLVKINPIIDWDDNDVWEFIRKYDLPYNSLYDKGYKRVGCVGCPMSYRQKQELENLPRYKALYIKAFQRYVDKHPPKVGSYFTSGEAMFQWWVGDFNEKHPKIEGQIGLFDKPLA